MTQNAREYFSILRKLHAGLCIGALLFMIMTVYLVEFADFASEDQELNFVLIIVSPVLAIIGFIASRILFTKRIEAINQDESMESKMTNYQVALILKWALYEGPLLFGLISYMLTGNQVFLLIAFTLLAGLYMQRPTKEAMMEDIKLSRSEYDKINNE